MPSDGAGSTRTSSCSSSRRTAASLGGPVCSSWLELVRGGSHSEFEIWGLPHLLEVPGLPPVQRQYALRTAIGTIHLDGALPTARLGIELDGAAYHRSPDNWARDRRRDSAALALDWATVRIDYRRGLDDPQGARAEIAAAFHVRAARISLEGGVT